MRKESVGSSAVETQGHMVDVSHHRPLHHAPKPQCSHCSMNIKIASTLDDGKIMRIKGCKEDQFHFDGCTTSGPAAAICVNSGKSGGVRLLKNDRKETVGYGSCCVPGHEDSIVATTIAFCEEPVLKAEASNLVTETKSEIHEENIDSAAANSSIVAVKGFWDAFPKNATSIEQGISMLPHHLQFLPMLIMCLVAAVFIYTSTAFLLYGHVTAGVTITGTIRRPHATTTTFFSLLWAIPVFTTLGIFGMVFPELSAIWQFLQALMLTQTLRAMPAMFTKIAGGRVQLQRNLKALGDNAEPLHVFSQFPFCILRCFVEAKPPEIDDVCDLEWALAITCTILPVLSFCEMACGQEASLQAELAHPSLAIVAPAVATFVRIMEVLFLALSMAALRGLHVLANTASPQRAKEMDLHRKSLYCQFFIGGMRLAPIFYHLVQPEPESLRAIASRSMIVCAASLICTCIGWKAFSVSAKHYPELLAISRCSDGKRAPLKPVLESVQFCPFCGSGDMDLEPESSEAASCPRCRARHVPVTLIVHRDRTPASAQETKAAGSEE